MINEMLKEHKSNELINVFKNIILEYEKACKYEWSKNPIEYALEQTLNKYRMGRL